MYTLIAYTHELWYFLPVCSYSPFELCLGASNPKSFSIVSITNILHQACASHCKHIATSHESTVSTYAQHLWITCAHLWVSDSPNVILPMSKVIRPIAGFPKPTTDTNSFSKFTGLSHSSRISAAGIANSVLKTPKSNGTCLCRLL